MLSLASGAAPVAAAPSAPGVPAAVCFLISARASLAAATSASTESPVALLSAVDGDREAPALVA